MRSVTSVKVENPFIKSCDAFKLCISLISEFQNEQIRKGNIPQYTHIDYVCANMSKEERNELFICEETFGIDSIMLLDLVAKVTEYFGLNASGIEDFLLVKKTLGDWAKLIEQHFILVGPSAEITFSTSGSTGKPKLVSHSRESLEMEAFAISEFVFEKKLITSRIFSAVPVHHIYGFLWSIILPRLVNCQNFLSHNLGISFLARECIPGDVIIATPFLWEKFHLQNLKLRDGITGISSASPTTLATWEASDALGLKKFIDVYGSTETGGIGWREQEKKPFQIMSHLNRIENKVQRAQCGTILNLQDNLGWKSEREFYVLGRHDSVVQVAGTNVDLRFVGDFIRECDFVEDVYIRKAGERLKCFVVSKIDDTENLEEKLRQHLNSLPAGSRPTNICFGRQAPLNETGKVFDW